MDDGPPRRGLNTQKRLPFVHTDIISAYSPWCSPSTPDEYVRALARQYALGPESHDQLRPALAIADYGLHSVVKTASPAIAPASTTSWVYACASCHSARSAPFSPDFTRTDVDVGEAVAEGIIQIS